MDAEPRRQPRSRLTDLRPGWRGQIVVPADARYAEAAAILRQGIPAPLDGSGHTVALGCLADNPVIERLYRERSTVIDRYFPGAGGHVIHTLVDPWGEGRNVVVLGVSGPAEATETVRSFLRLLDESGGQLSPVYRVQAGEPTKNYTFRRLVTWEEESDGDRALRTGLDFLATGERPHLDVFHDSILAIARKDHHRHLHDWYVLILYEILKDLDVFTDGERDEVVSWIRRRSRGTEGTRNEWYRWGLTRPRARHNHQTATALGIFFGCRLLARDYGDTEAAGLLDEVDAFFAPYRTAERPACDSPHLQFDTLTQVITYFLARGETPVHFARSGERILDFTDNFGYCVPFGDTDFLLPAPLGMIHYITRDGRYLWPAERSSLIPHPPDPYQDRPVAFFPPRFRVDGSPTVPTDLIGVRRSPLDRLLYDTFAAPECPKPANVDFDKTFDKVVLRGGLDPTDDYVLIDGISWGGHDYDDGNSLLCYATQGRNFLTGYDFLRLPRQSEHNSLSVSRNGLGSVYPPLAELVELRETPDGAVVRTAIRRWSGGDWVRTWHWYRNALMVVLDEFTALEPGDYVLRLNWRMFGTGELDGARSRTSQTSSGQRWDFHLTCFGPGVLMQWWHELPRCAHYYEQAFPPQRRDALAPPFDYPGPFGFTRVGRRYSCRLSAGESVRWATAFYASSRIRPQTYDVAADGPDLHIRGEGRSLIVPNAVTPDDRPLHFPALRGALAAPASPESALALSWSRYAAGPPCVALGRGQLASVADNMIRISPATGQASERSAPSAAPVTAISASELPGANPALVAGYEDGHLMAWDPNGQLLWRFQPSYRETGYFLWRLCTPAVVRVWVGDLDGDGHSETLAAFGDNELRCFDDAGRERWRHHSIAPFSQFLVHTYPDGRREVLGGQDILFPWADVTVLRSDGTKRLRYLVDPWISALTALAADGHDLFAGTNIGTIRCYDLAQPVMARQQLVAWDFPQLFPQPLWTAKMGDKVAGLVRIQGTLVAGCSDGFVTGLEARTGDVLWYDDTGAEILGLRGVGAPAAPSEAVACHTDRVLRYGAEGRRDG